MLLTISYCSAAAVIELHDGNFDSIVNNNKFIAVEFYTNW